ncbi:MAG: DUF3302 domain-containing protein [Pseudomonadota bacterium]
MLEIVALGILVFIGVSLLFGAIKILEIPHKIAAERNHPHSDAIYYAGWVSLFTLHLIWPALWIWSAAYRENLSPRFAEIDEDTAVNDKSMLDNVIDNENKALINEDITDSVSLLGHRYDVLDDRLDRIEKAIQAAGEAA